MKNKYTPILVALFIGVQSTFACEFCGVKNAVHHGQALNLMLVLARVLSAFSDTYGTASLEAYYNSYVEPEPEGLNLDDDDDDAEDIQPIYLVGENHFNAEDQLFHREIIAAAGRAELVVPSEGVEYEEDGNGVPVQTDGLPVYGAEDAFAVMVTNAVTMRSILNFPEEDLYQVETLEQLVSDFIDLVNQIIDPRNEAFTAALYANEDLRNNPLFKWIVQHKEALLKKDYKTREAVLRKSLSRFVIGKKPWFFNNIKPFINQVMGLLLEHMPTLAQNFQIPQQYLNYLAAPDQLEVLQVCKILAYWRNLFIIENLKKLHVHAQNLGLPMVVTFGREHIGHIRRGLEDAGLTVTSDLSHLPIDASIKQAKQQRIDEGEFGV